MSTSSLQILVVDDSPEDRLALRRLLTRTAPGRYTVSEVSRGDDCLAACAAAAPDCVLLDYRLPDMDGLAVLATLRAQSDVPVVLLTGVGTEALAVEALQRGAQDYLVKGDLTLERLQTTVQRAVSSVQLARERDQTLTLLTTVLESLPIGVGVFDSGLHVRQANPAFADLAGRPAAALTGQLLPALWPDLEAALAEPCAQVLRGESFRDLELHLPAGGGRAARWLSASGMLTHGGIGSAPLGVIAVQDVTVRVRAERALQGAMGRLQILAAASHAFAEAATDEPALLNRIARLTATPLVASCTIWRCSADSLWLHAAAVYNRDPVVQAILNAGFLDTSIPATDPHPAAAVASTGQPLLIPVIDPETIRATIAPELWSTFERVRPHSTIVVPLQARGAALGSLVFTRHDLGQPSFTTDDLTLAQDLADRAALALHNIQLYQQAQAAQQAAAEAHARLEALISSMPSGVGYLDQELRYQLVNPALARINGRAPAEHLERTLSELLPALAPQLEPLVRQVFATGEPVPAFELHGKPCPEDDVAHDWLISYFPVLGPTGTVVGVGVTITDVTAIKRTEAALRESQQNLASLIENTDGSIWSIDAQYRLIVGNALFQRNVTAAIGREPLPGERLVTFSLPHETLEAWRGWYDCALAGETFSIEVPTQVAPEPRTVEYRFNPIRTVAGAITGVTVFGRDITERLRTEQGLREAERKLRILFELLPVGVSILDSAGAIAYVNPALEQILRLDRASLIQGVHRERHYLRPDGTPMPPEAYASSLTARTHQAVADVETGIVTETGEVLWTSVSAAPVDFPDWRTVVVTTDITTRKQHEAALRASEANLRAILASTAQAYLLLDPALCLVHWNELAEAGVAERFGRSLSVGAPISDYMLPETVPARTALMQRALQGERIETELDVSTPAVPRWLAVAYAPVREPEGQIRGICVSTLDITARRQAEQELRASETRYRILFETMSQGVIYHDADGQIIAANPAAEHILGLTLSQMQGQISLDPRWHTIHEDGTAFADETYPALVTLRTGQEVRDVVMGVYHPDLETYRWISIQVAPQFRLGESTPFQVYALFNDITERRAATQALEHERRQLAAILNTMHENIMAAHPDGSLVLINPAALIMSNLDPTHPPANLAELAQQSPHEVITPDGQVLAPEDWPIPRVLGGEHIVGLELGLRSTLDGTERWHSFNGTPVYEQDGTLILGVVTGQDITERKRDEAQLRQQAAMLDHAQLFIDDAASRIVSWNQGAERLYGWTAEEALGRVSHELLQTRFPTSQEQVQAELLATGRWEGELVHHRRDGSVLVVASLQILFRDSSDVPTHILKVNNDVTALKRAEETLREREAQLELAHEVAGLGTWHHDLTAGLVTLDARAQAHYGAEEATLPVAAILAHVHPDDALRLEREMRAILESSGTGRTQNECRVMLPDGGVRWLANHAYVVFAGEGATRQPVLSYGTTQDITARKAEEEALRAAYARAEASAGEAAKHAARLESLLAYAPVGISLLDSTLRFQHVNASLAEMNGLPPEAHLGHTIQEVLPALAPVLEEIYHQVLATGMPLLDVEIAGETPALPGVNRLWQASYFPVRAADGSTNGVGVVVIEITAQWQAEQARDTAHRQLEAIVEALDEGVIAIQRDGSVVAINQSAREYMLTDPTARPRTMGELSTLIGMTLYDTSGQPLAAENLPMMRVLRGERFKSWELKLRPAGSDEERWVLISGKTAAGEEGEHALGIVTRSDITERKRAELALADHAETLSRTNVELTRALKLKDEFLAMMSHELRTPLNVVLGVSEALDEELYGPVSERQRKALTTVTQSGRHLLAILSDILDLAYIEAGKAALDVQPVDLDILCRTALQFVHGAAQQKGLRLLRTVASGVEGLRADERRLTQILVNLLDNAVKFTPAGGTVGLEVMDDAAQERIAFTVWDTGIGIAEPDYARLFQPFTQIDGRLSRQYEGIGLGLTLVRRLVDLHGGSISLESTLGQGSRFTVRLPWSSEENVAPATPPAPGPLPLTWAQPPRLVIADDHELTLQFYAELLREQGCQVALARTGAEAVSQVQATRPDVAILDLQMPELDGLTAIRQIRADLDVATTPIIALTALAMPGDRERCIAAGASAYLTKPAGIRTLMETIAEVLTDSSTGYTSE